MGHQSSRNQKPVYGPLPASSGWITDRKSKRATSRTAPVANSPLLRRHPPQGAGCCHFTGPHSRYAPTLLRSTSQTPAAPGEPAWVFDIQVLATSPRLVSLLLPHSCSAASFAPPLPEPSRKPNDPDHIPLLEQLNRRSNREARCHVRPEVECLHSEARTHVWFHGQIGEDGRRLACGHGHR